MNTAQFYVAASIVVMLVVAVPVFVVSKNRPANRLSPVAGLAFGFILAGMMFGDNRSIGYGLMAIGVFLAVADIFRKSRAGPPDDASGKPG